VCVKLDVCLSVWDDGLRVSGFGDWMTVWGDQGLVALVGQQTVYGFTVTRAQKNSA
jgi:hypothetical protein